MKSIAKASLLLAVVGCTAITGFEDFSAGRTDGAVRDDGVDAEPMDAGRDSGDPPDAGDSGVDMRVGDTGAADMAPSDTGVDTGPATLCGTPEAQCMEGTMVDCATSCGTTGTGTCSDTCRLPAMCTPPAEICNGRDDDCDGIADNGATYTARNVRLDPRSAAAIDGDRVDAIRIAVTDNGPVVIFRRIGTSGSRDRRSLEAIRISNSGSAIGNPILISAVEDDEDASVLIDPIEVTSVGSSIYLAYAPRGAREDGTVRLRLLQVPESGAINVVPLPNPTGVTRPINDISMSASEEDVAIFIRDRSTRFLTIADRTADGTLSFRGLESITPNPVRLATLDDGQHVAAGVEGGDVRLYRAIVEAGAAALRPLANLGPLSDGALQDFAAGGDRLAVIRGGGTEGSLFTLLPPMYACDGCPGTVLYTERRGAALRGTPGAFFTALRNINTNIFTVDRWTTAQPPESVADASRSRGMASGNFAFGVTRNGNLLVRQPIRGNSMTARESEVSLLSFTCTPP